MFGPAFSGSLAFGLDQFIACIESAVPPCSYFFALVPVSSATGAIHCACSLVWIACPVSRSSSDRVPLLVSRVPSVTATPGASHDEQSLAAHGVAGFCRAEYSCRNAVAQPFQWRDDGAELSVRVPRHVLAEDKIRPALLGNAADFGGKEPLPIGPGALAGDAVFLAGIARSEDMNEATPWPSVEGEQVRPDRSLMKPPCFHRRDQACGGCGFPLHVAYAASRCAEQSQSEVDSKFEPADAGAEGHDVDGTYSHITHSPARLQAMA